jgi:hypothetical protein
MCSPVLWITPHSKSRILLNVLKNRFRLCLIRQMRSLSRKEFGRRLRSRELTLKGPSIKPNIKSLSVRMWKTPSSAAQIWLFSSRIQPGSHGSKNATNQHYKDAAINLFCKHVRWMLKYSNVSQKQRIPRNLDRARADNLWVLIVVAGCDKPKCSQTELGSLPPLVNAPSKWEWKIAHENVHI